VFTSQRPPVEVGPARGAGTPPDGVTVSDVWFVFLTLAVFGLLTLIAKGMERL
jgi:hypothetical protein